MLKRVVKHDVPAPPPPPPKPIGAPVVPKPAHPEVKQSTPAANPQVSVLTPKPPEHPPKRENYPIGIKPKTVTRGIAPLAPPDDLPARNGWWRHWNASAILKLEAELAKAAKMTVKMRGAVPAHHGGPELWRIIPWNTQQNGWVWENRQKLPDSYSCDDWWSDESLEEARLAYEHLIPWSLRGPPNGLVGNRIEWRRMRWRPGARKWMSRGGDSVQKAARDHWYGKVGKVKLTPTFHFGRVRTEDFIAYPNLGHRHFACTKWLHHYPELA